jgi:hypothetical protein
LLPQRVRLTNTLNSLQQALRRTRQLLNMPATGEKAEQTSAAQFHTIAPQITEKLPFEYLPDLNRLRRLQQEATAILEQVASVQMEGPELAASEEIQRLLDQSMAALLEYWARMDLFMLAGHQTRVEMDVVFEAGVDIRTEYLRRVLLGMTVAMISAILAIVPVIWTRDRWDRITGVGITAQADGNGRPS